jgi:hypothetical protein
VRWQTIIENSKRLAVLLNTHLTCLRLAKFGTTLILANAICMRNILQEKPDPVWEEELLGIMDEAKVSQIMKHPRRLRYLAVIYGFQRIVELCIEYDIMPREVIRDINPTIITMSCSLGACTRIRITRLPWIIAVHLQFILCIFIIVLPMTLVGIQKEIQIESDWGFVVYRINWIGIFIYEIIISYAFFGLCRMALDIDDPWSFSREIHSFGFWGFYEYHSNNELDNLRDIFKFRAVRNKDHKMTGDGKYGDWWVSTKLEKPILKVINSDLTETHNLYGRTDKIRDYIQMNKRTTTYWENFNKTTVRSDDEYTFESTSAVSESEEPVRESIIPTVIERLKQFSLRIPSTRRGSAATTVACRSYLSYS